MTKLDLIKQVYQILNENKETKISFRKVENIINLTFNEMINNFQEKKTITINNLGTFLPHTSKSTRRKNLHTGEMFEVPQKTKIKFRPSSYLKNL